MCDDKSNNDTSTSSRDGEYLPPVYPKEEELGEYYFESDALALRENKDYQMLLHTLVRLQAQRAKAVKVSSGFG